MDLNKIKRSIVVSSIILNGLVIQTKSAVAEILDKDKNIQQTEKIVDISDITSHSLDDTFSLEQDSSNKDSLYQDSIDTEEIKNIFYTPGFLNKSEKQEFDTLRNKATKHKYRDIYKGEIAELSTNINKNSDKIILTLLILSRVDSANSLVKRAFKQRNASVKIKVLYEAIEGTIISKEGLNKEIERGKELDKKIAKVEKEMEELNKEKEKLDKESEKLYKINKELNELNKSLEEMKKLFESYKKSKKE